MPVNSPLFCNRTTYSKTHATANIDATCLIDVNGP